MAEVMNLIPEKDYVAACDVLRNHGAEEPSIISSKLPIYMEIVAEQGFSLNFNGISNTSLSGLRPYAFAWLTGVENATVFLPRVSNITAHCFDRCFFASFDVEKSFPSAITISDAAFKNCGTMEYFRMNTDDVRLYDDSHEGEHFANCLSLKTFVMINTDGAIMELPNANAFSNTPIEAGTGYIYVPKALIEQYKVAPNWSVYASQFRAIEDYPDIVNLPTP